MGRKKDRQKQVVVSGNLGEAIRQAQALAKRQQNPPQKGNSQKGSSLKERLLATAKGAFSAAEIRQTFKEADEAGATPEIVQLFAETVRSADEIGVRRLAATKSMREAAKEWFSLSFKEQEAELREWAKTGDTLAASVVEVLEQFNQNIPLRDVLREVVSRFEGPCRPIENLSQLRSFLDRLVEEGLVHRINGPAYVPEHGVIIPIDSGKILYVPKAGIRTAKIGWVFVKEAEAKARANQEALDGLKAKATPGLTPERVSRDEEGKLFLFLSSGQAVLIECKLEAQGWMTARVVEALGLELQLPSELVLWKERLDPLKWPDRRIALALGEWERKLSDWRQEREVRQEEAAAEVASLVSLATIPGSFAEQGLTRLLKGEKGTVAIWHRSFGWSDKKGLFGIALERTDEGLYLRQVVSPEFDFDQGLVDEKLPLVVDPERPSAKLEQLSRMEERRFLSLKMVEKLLRLRLQAEERVVLGEPAPENDKS